MRRATNHIPIVGATSGKTDRHDKVMACEIRRIWFSVRNGPDVLRHGVIAPGDEIAWNHGNAQFGADLLREPIRLPMQKVCDHRPAADERCVPTCQEFVVHVGQICGSGAGATVNAPLAVVI